MLTISLLNPSYEYVAFWLMEEFIFNVDFLFSLSLSSQEEKTVQQNSFLLSLRTTLLSFYKNYFSSFGK
jgi:hypothetical protein